ncbi:MAG: molybdenum cofactor guanylyltransferase [Gammaproteobacteria bacterium]|nr:molybdenum cofactor guanylyltransferase [Gammaproteobacteria bacterium]
MQKNTNRNMPPNQLVTGLVLAGGQASRMGGEDKGLILLNDKPLVMHVLERLIPQVNSIVISCNRNHKQYSRFGCPIITDERRSLSQQPRFNGPLAGIIAGMKEIGTPYTLIVPCDCPALPLDLQARLFTGLTSENKDISVPFDGERRQPLFLLTKTQRIGALQEYYEQGGRSIKAWLNGESVTDVNFSNETGSFTNLNTREELRSYTSHRGE